MSLDLVTSLPETPLTFRNPNTSQGLQGLQRPTFLTPASGSYFPMFLASLVLQDHADSLLTIDYAKQANPW